MISKNNYVNHWWIVNCTYIEIVFVVS